MDDTRVNHILDAIRITAARILPQGSRVSLYGSRARGEAREDSDWDLHVLIPGEERLPLEAYDKYAWPFEQLGLEYGEVFNARVYSFAGWLRRSFLPFYKNVSRDSILLFKN